MLVCEKRKQSMQVELMVILYVKCERRRKIGDS